MTTKQRVIKIYETDLKHPSLQYIADKVGRSKTRVAQIIDEYKKSKAASRSKSS